MKRTTITIMIGTALTAAPALANELVKLSYADSTITTKAQKNASGNINLQIFDHLDVNAITALDNAEMESTLGATIEREHGMGYGSALSAEGFSFNTFGREVAKSATWAVANTQLLHIGLHGEPASFKSTLEGAFIGTVLGGRFAIPVASGVRHQQPVFSKVHDFTRNTAITVTTVPWNNTNTPPISLEKSSFPNIPVTYHHYNTPAAFREDRIQHPPLRDIPAYYSSHSVNQNPEYHFPPALQNGNENISGND